LKPAWEKAAKSLEGLVQVVAVNCDDEDNKQLCGKMGIKGFPTLKTVRVTAKKGKPVIQEYRGERSAKAIVEEGKGLLYNHVKRITDKEIAGWLSEGNDTAKAIIFTEKGTTSATIKKIALEFLGNMKFAQVRNKDTEVVDMFGISSYPSLVVLPGGDASPLIYDGKKSADKSASESAASSHASAEKSEAPTVAADETLKDEAETPARESPGPVANEDAPKPIRVPNVAPPLPTLADQASLEAACLGAKTGTCILVLLPHADGEDAEIPVSAAVGLASLAELKHRHHQRGAHIFPFFAVPATNEGAATLRESLGLEKETTEVVAVNGKRGWWTHLETAEKGSTIQVMEDWVDAIKMGDLKKEKFPEGVLVAQPKEDKHDEL